MKIKNVKKDFKKLSQALIVSGALMGMQSAQAADATSTFTVGATVLSSCIVVALPLVFGSFDPTGAGTQDATNNITVTCTSGTSYNVKLNKGANGTSVTNRKMLSTIGADTINYQLFRDTGRTQNWGETVGSDTLAGSATGLPQIVTVYGRLPSGQTSPAGLYTDTINVTVTY